MCYQDWKENFSTLFVNIDFPDIWTGIRFRSKWTKSNSAGLPVSYTKDECDRYAQNPQFMITCAFPTEIMLSLTQTGGRLPLDGHYFTYPFKETLRNTNLAVWELPAGSDENSILETFDTKMLKLLTPIKLEKENSGRTKLEAGKIYIIVPALEIKGGRGDFFLNVYFDQKGRDVLCKRVFHPNDK